MTPSATVPVTSSHEPPPTSITPMVPAGGLASVASAPVKASWASCSPVRTSTSTPHAECTAAQSSSRLLAARIAAVPTTCTSLTPCWRATRACAATIAASSATASAEIAPPSSGTRRRKRRTATTSRRRPSSRSATSSRVVLVPMSTHAQFIWLPSSPQVSTSAPAILVRDLRKAYGEHEAVRGLDFEVAVGEVFGLLGPNGAGKTTTVEILEGYRARTAGIVSVLGHDPQQRSRDLRERVGIVLQSTGMYRHITPREALGHFAHFYPHPRDVEEVIAITGLQEKADAYVRTLSGGQQRRLDLALALIGDPELIFLDEPTTGFDPAARRNAWEVIRSLQELGKTILLTTHYLDEAQALCDRVAIVKEGRIVAEGPPGELGAASTRYRVAWRDESGELQTREVDDPTALLHQLTSAALARGAAAARPVGDAALAGGRLPRADRRGRRRRPTVAEAAVLAYRQWRLERRMFWRNPTAAFFSFVLPLLFLFLFGAIFSGDQKTLNIIVPGILGMSVMSTTFNALAMNITFLREEGVLKRIHGTPMPPVSYLGGVTANAVSNATVQIVDRGPGRASSSSASAGPRTGSSSSSSASSASPPWPRSASPSRTSSRTSTPPRPTRTSSSCRSSSSPASSTTSTTPRSSCATSRRSSRSPTSSTASRRRWSPASPWPTTWGTWRSSWRGASFGAFFAVRGFSWQSKRD